MNHVLETQSDHKKKGTISDRSRLLFASNWQDYKRTGALEGEAPFNGGSASPSDPPLRRSRIAEHLFGTPRPLPEHPRPADAVSTSRGAPAEKVGRITKEGDRRDRARFLLVRWQSGQER